MVRLFVAVEIENSDVLLRILKVKRYVSSCSKGKGIKPVEDENVHLTLRFIGEVPENLLPEISECVKLASSFPSFTMKILGLGAFPSPSRPRVIWVGVDEGAKKLKELRKQLETCLSRYSKPDRNRFVPHITIARVKGKYDLSCLREILTAYEKHVFGVSSVTQVKLKKSVLRPEGPIYSDVTVVKLEG